MELARQQGFMKSLPQDSDRDKYDLLQIRLRFDF